MLDRSHMSEERKTPEELAQYKANLVRARNEVLPLITTLNETQLIPRGLLYKDDGKFTHHYQLAQEMIGGADLIKRLIEDLVVEEIANILCKDIDSDEKKAQINDLRLKRIPYLAIEDRQPAFCINESELGKLNLTTTTQARNQSVSLTKYTGPQRSREHVKRCLDVVVRPLILDKGKKMGLTEAQSELLVTKYFYTSPANSTLIMQRLIDGDELVPPLENLLKEKFAEADRLMGEGWLKAAELSKKLGLNSSAMTMNILTIRDNAIANGQDPDSLAKKCSCGGTRTETYLISPEGQQALLDLRAKIEKNGRPKHYKAKTPDALTQR